MIQREHKRGAYERWRRKRWLWFKNRELQEQYMNRFNQKQESIYIASKLVWWRRIIISIQKFFYNLLNKKVSQ